MKKSIISWYIYDKNKLLRKIKNSKCIKFVNVYTHSSKGDFRFTGYVKIININYFNSQIEAKILFISNLVHLNNYKTKKLKIDDNILVYYDNFVY